MGSRPPQDSPGRPAGDFDAFSRGSAEKAARYALVVDDDIDFCTIMREMLRWRGYEAQIAYSAADAWHSLSKIDPDVMLIDIAMPDVDGLELVRELRRDENYAETPIIIVTARAIRDMLEASREAGADFFLTKPVSIFDSAPTNTQPPSPTDTPVPSPTPILPTPTPTVQIDLPPRELKVAFIGDQGTNNDAQAVLMLIKEEGAELVVHQGDLAYGRNFALWQPMVDDALGSSFPYFFSIGNHDIREWDQYQQWFSDRLNQIPEAECTGELGINSVCVYKGLSIVLSGAGTSGGNHEEYIWEAFATDNHIWRICSWHKNMRKMQSGSMLDETGWDVYEACRENGAIIATAHEHSYSRTFLMASFENQTVASESSTLVLEPGKSFAFVSGLGGRSIRTQDQNWPWMASVFTSDQNADYGALFCTFHVDGIPDQAECYFKDILGRVPDRFTLISDLSGSGVLRRDRPNSTPVPTLSPGGSPLVDAVSSGSTNGSNLSIAHTTSGSNRLMLVGVSINNDNFETVASITYGGAPLALVDAATQSDDARVEIWKLVDPPLGNHDVVITFSGDLERHAVAGVVTLTGVKLSEPLGAFAGNSNTSSSASLTVSSEIGDLVFSVFSCETCGSVAFLSPATAQWAVSAGNGIEIGAGATNQGMGPDVTVSAALENGDHWAMGGISVRPGPNP